MPEFGDVLRVIDLGVEVGVSEARYNAATNELWLHARGERHIFDAATFDYKGQGDVFPYSEDMTGFCFMDDSYDQVFIAGARWDGSDWRAEIRLVGVPGGQYDGKNQKLYQFPNDTSTAPPDPVSIITVEDRVFVFVDHAGELEGDGIYEFSKAELLEGGAEYTVFKLGADFTGGDKTSTGVLATDGRVLYVFTDSTGSGGGRKITRFDVNTAEVLAQNTAPDRDALVYFNSKLYLVERYSFNRNAELSIIATPFPVPFWSGFEKTVEVLN